MSTCYPLVPGPLGVILSPESPQPNSAKFQAGLLLVKCCHPVVSVNGWLARYHFSKLDGEVGDHDEMAEAELVETKSF